MTKIQKKTNKKLHKEKLRELRLHKLEQQLKSNIIKRKRNKQSKIDV